MAGAICGKTVHSVRRSPAVRPKSGRQIVPSAGKGITLTFRTPGTRRRPWWSRCSTPYSRRGARQSVDDRGYDDRGHDDRGHDDRGHDDRGEECFTVRDGDTAAIRAGYHPVVAAPGYRLSHLRVRGGERRRMAPYLDPRHAWVLTGR
jgi:hypothetical protein